MKKLLFAALLVLSLASVGYAQTAESSGLHADDITIKGGMGYLAAVVIITDGSNDAALVCYDNTSAAGKVLFKGTVAAASNFGGATFAIPVAFNTGLHCVVTGTGAAYIVYTQ